MPRSTTTAAYGVNKPVYFQVLFMFDRIKALAPEHPEWETQEPFASVLKGDLKAVASSGERGLMALAAATPRRHDHRGI